jgi:hypothetical protein
MIPKNITDLAGCQVLAEGIAEMQNLPQPQVVTQSSPSSVLE